MLYNVLRNPLACMVFNLLVLHSDFKTGEIVTNYPRLEELCRPPSREKGGRAKGSSIRQIRYVIDQLIEYGLVKRNADANTKHGTLRLFIRKRKTEAAN